MSEIKFPKGFLWGASTSSHQIEGNNHNDWTVWEKEKARHLAAAAGPQKDYGCGALGEELWDINTVEAKSVENYVSGQATDSYKLWREDLRLLKQLNLNAFRFTIEWSRIEPAPGEYSSSAIEHYRRLIQEYRRQGITPFVSLSHWTLPVWASEQGGWRSKSVIDAFAGYSQYVAGQLANEKGCYWLIINEPEVIAGQAYLLGEWPPQKRNVITWRRVLRNFKQAHKSGYRAIKAINPDAPVSSAINNICFEAEQGWLWPLNKLISLAADHIINHNFFKGIKGHMDFVGINHYIHCVINGGIFKNKYPERSDLGWYLYPSSLGRVIDGVTRYKLPVVVIEHGLADSRDKYREWYIKGSLAGMSEAIENGADVIGYLHWSLLDNFEWDKGFWPKFGLVAVDRKTMERTIRPSARVYADIAKHGGFKVDEK